MKSAKTNIALVVFAVLAITAVLLGAAARRQNPHLGALVSVDPRIGCFDDNILRGELDAAGDAAVPFLREHLRQQPGLVLQLLTRLSSTGAVNWFHDWISESIADSVMQRFSERYHSQQHALRALLLLGPMAAAARPELMLMTSNSGFALRGTALTALAAISPTDPVVVSNYLAILSDNNQSDRFFLTGDFAQVWPQPPHHLEALIARLRDNDDGIRSRAARALAQYGVGASNAVPQLIPLLTDRSGQVRTSAAYALGLISPPHADQAVAVMLGQQQTNTMGTGSIAHQLYAALGPAAARAEPHLRRELSKVLTNGFAGSPAFALWRVTHEASPDVIRGLTRGAEQPVQRFQLMSLEGLREIGPPASNAVPVLERLLKAPHRAIRRNAEKALQAITGQPPPSAP